MCRYAQPPLHAPLYPQHCQMVRRRHQQGDHRQQTPAAQVKYGILSSHAPPLRRAIGAVTSASLRFPCIRSDTPALPGLNPTPPLPPGVALVCGRRTCTKCYKVTVRKELNEHHARWTQLAFHPPHPPNTLPPRSAVTPGQRLTEQCCTQAASFSLQIVAQWLHGRYRHPLCRQ